ncbi:MAG: PKD domain-containing protein, partial [Acidimicrobiia bacterium]|nr:PKD domain-containing protein [Acidimicrobiia bacterium]
MRFGLRHLVALSLGAVLACTLAGTGSAGALTSTSQPHLTLNRLIRTTPFVGSSVKVRDNEDTAYVASDDSLWIADDNGNAIYEINRTTGALRREITQTAFINSPQLGGTNTAGNSRSQDLEALAYDANADALYAFSGSTGAIPTVYKLARDANHQFQVQSWQSVPTEWTGAGWRQADGKLYVANDSTIRTYDFASNTFGPAFSISGISKIFDIDFDDVTGDLVAVNHSQRLYRASMTTRTILSGWNGIDLTPFGMLDSRGVEVIGEQLFISDGYDYRSASDPMNHAVFVFDVTGPGGGGSAPTASFTTSTTSGTAPLGVNFTDTSTGAPTSWAWTFGDGSTSTAQNPSHTYTSAGTFTATLTAGNTNGSTSVSHTISVDSVPTAPTALFATSTASGPAPLGVNFTDTSTGAPTSWAWTFGDGSTSNAQNPSHTYTSTGTFTATLTAANLQGSDSVSHTITVGPAPTELILPLDADTYVNSPRPTKNYATYSTMKLHAPSSEYRPLIKFTVNGLSGPPTSVKLRLYVTDASASGGDWYLVSNA